MLPSSPADRLRWPRDQFPQWNRVMDLLDIEIANGMVDFKWFKMGDSTDLEAISADIVELLTAPTVPDVTLL